MKTSILLFVLLTLLLGCSSDDEITKSEEQEDLTVQFTAIKLLAESEDCIDANNWLITPIGSKPCGGCTSYLPYKNTINVVLFLEKLEIHRVAMEKFNTKWGIISDCSITPQPTDVVCENNMAILKYN